MDTEGNRKPPPGERSTTGAPEDQDKRPESGHTILCWCSQWRSNHILNFMMDTNKENTVTEPGDLDHQVPEAGSMDTSRVSSSLPTSYPKNAEDLRMLLLPAKVRLSTTAGSASNRALPSDENPSWILQLDQMEEVARIYSLVQTENPSKAQLFNSINALPHRMEASNSLSRRPRCRRCGQLNPEA